MWAAPSSKLVPLLLGLVGALVLYVYVLRTQLSAADSQNYALRAKLNLQNAAVDALRAEAKIRQKRAAKRVAEVVAVGEEVRLMHLTQGATAQDMQTWWDSRSR